MQQHGPLRIGSLDDDVTALAGKVQQQLADGSKIVWVDDRGLLYLCCPEKAGEIPTTWIAGTFSIGRSVSAIAEDLRVLFAERSKDWILK